MTTTKLIKQLPKRVVVNGYEFDLNIFNNGKNDIRITYCLPLGMTWENSFFNHELKNSLYTISGIKTDKELKEGLNEMHNFLTTNYII